MQRLIWLQTDLILFLFPGAEALIWFFPSPYRIKAAVHSVSSILAIAAATYLAHRIYPVLRSARAAWEALPAWLIAALAANLAAAISDNWVYMRYRGEGGPRKGILTSAGSFHNVLMEFRRVCLLVSVLFFDDSSFLRLLLWRAGLQAARIGAVFRFADFSCVDVGASWLSQRHRLGQTEVRMITHRQFHLAPTSLVSESQQLIVEEKKIRVTKIKPSGPLVVASLAVLFAILTLMVTHYLSRLTPDAIFSFGVWIPWAHGEGRSR